MSIYPEEGTGGAVTVFWCVTTCGLVEISRIFGSMSIYPEEGTGGAVTVFWYVTPCGLVIIDVFFRIQCLSRFNATEQIPFILSDDGNKFGFRNSFFNQKETTENNIQ